MEKPNKQKTQPHKEEKKNTLKITVVKNPRLNKNIKNQQF